MRVSGSRCPLALVPCFGAGSHARLRPPKNACLSSLANAAWGVVGLPVGSYRDVPSGSGTETTLDLDTGGDPMTLLDPRDWTSYGVR